MKRIRTWFWEVRLGVAERVAPRGMCLVYEDDLDGLLVLQEQLFNEGLLDDCTGELNLGEVG